MSGTGDGIWNRGGRAVVGHDRNGDGKSSSDDLWHLHADSAWEKMTLPRDGSGARFVLLPREAGGQREQELRFLPSGDLMLLAQANRAGALLATRKPDQVLDLAATPAAPSVAAKPAALGQVTVPTSSCKQLFVVLYKLSRVAPADYDFPLTRAALKGHTELAGTRFAETEDGGTRYLVAFVPSFARGQELLRLVTAKVQGSRPQMLCGEPPKVNRRLEIDLVSGEMRR